MEQKYIVAIEIGSSKIKGAIGTVDESGGLTILSIEEEKMIDYVRYGCIQNVAEVGTRVMRILRLLENHGRVSPRKIKSVYVGLGGRSLSATGTEVQRNLPDEIEITERIISQIKDEARAKGIPDKDIVDVIPRSFYVDKQPIANPVGVFGQHITANLNLITCKPQIKKNLNLAVCDRLQMAINGYIVRPTAIADLVLSDDEKRLGCMLVDFGAETTTVSIYKDGTLHYLSTIPMGSRNITRDITAINHFLEERAEEIKKAVGCATQAETIGKKSAVDGIDSVEVNNYVQARAGEIVANVLEQITYAEYRASDLPGGIIVVGGGAKLRNFNALLENRSGMKVRSGAPLGLITISDNRIQPNESIDVIAILAAAARGEVIECVESQVSVVTTVTDNDKLNVVDDDDDAEDETKVKGPGAIQRLKERLIRMMKDPMDDYDDDEDEDTDDFK